MGVGNSRGWSGRRTARPDRAERTALRPWQFTIRDLLFATAAIALMLGWLATFAPTLKRCGIYPGLYPGDWGLVSVGVLLYGWFVLRRPNGASQACILIVVAWYIALGNTAYPIGANLPGHWWNNCNDGRQVIQEGVHFCLLSGITLPLCFTVPLVYAVITRARGTLNPVTRWLLLSLAIPLADATLTTIFISGTLGTWRF